MTASNEQINTLLSETRAETSTAVGQDAAHPHEAEVEIVP